MGRLTAIVLGAAAGGGFPQWNCCCPTCRLAWDDDPRVKRRTQASLAASADGRRWILLNASPDLRSHIEATPALRPQGMLRGSPIAGVIVTGAEVDQIGGLLTMRERGEFTLYGTAETLAAIAANPIFGVLAAETVHRQAVALGETFLLPNGLRAEVFAVPGKVPLYLENERLKPADDGANVGVSLSNETATLAYVPGAAAITPSLLRRIGRADAVLFDGTLFRDDEMIVAGTGTKTGRRMGHLPLDGPDGTLRQLAGVPGRRILTHINNTNPILVAGSPERCRVEAAGYEVAEDGMEIVL